MKITHLFSRFVSFCRGIRSDSSSIVIIEPGVRIRRSSILISKGSKLILRKNCRIEGYQIRLSSGLLEVGENGILSAQPHSHPRIFVNDGQALLRDHCLIRGNISVRFGGHLSLGRYVMTAQDSEIRCDDQIRIGDFTGLSYEVLVWDTNTHVLVSPEEHAARVIRDFPFYAKEIQKPKTAPVWIGKNCGIFQRAVILKGVVIGDGSFVAVNSVVTQSVPSESLAVGNPATVKARSFETEQNQALYRDTKLDGRAQSETI